MIHHGDCLEVMAAMEAGSVDAVVTDPPYGLSFMGKHWDHGLPGVDFWTEALRLLPPSGYLLAFGGTRTWHRLACALEDAGFEIRDTLMWLYGSGFPKGKSCLKPAWEPIILARKPGPMRALGIEECRVGTTDYSQDEWTQKGASRPTGNAYGAHKPSATPLPSGRWPANLILDEEAGAMLDGQTGNRPGGGNIVGGRDPGYGGGGATKAKDGMGDSGGASRFFYCAKASRSERNAGCEGMALRERDASKWAYLCNVCGCRFGHNGKPDCGHDDVSWVECRPTQNHHPTVKPLALMRWLVKLVAYPGDVVLDPFMGSGTTGVACAMEGRKFVGIEREAEYVEIARRRIEAASAQLRLAIP